MAGSISGKVFDQRNMQPIDGASIHLSGTADQSAASGGDGSFAFNNLTAGDYEMVVSKEGYENSTYGPLPVIDDAPFDLNLVLQVKA